MSLQKRILSKEFVVLAEMDTPKGVDVSELVTQARRIKGRVDAVVIPDMANGVMRMSAIGGGVLMHQQGMEAIIHICPRDRNRIALEGDALTAHVLGVQNLLVTPGEEMALGDHIDAKTVDDLDENGLLSALRTLQDGRDLAGIDLKGAPLFFVGGRISRWADEAGLDEVLAAARSKVEAGAQYLVAPPVFDLEAFQSFQGRASALGVPIIAAVFLIKSVGVARYMNANLPGVNVSEETIKRLRKAPDRATESLKIAGEAVAALKNLADGVIIQTVGWEHRLPAILDYAGI